MNDRMLRLGLVLALLGLGVFSLVVTLLGLVVRLLFGTWEIPIQFLAAVSLVLAIPIGYQIWKQFLSSRL